MSSKIEWTNETWNPVAGCTKCSPGCLNCYAERMSYRLMCMGIKKYENSIDIIEPKIFKWSGEIFCDEKALNTPLHRKKPRRIFVCSMSDLFHEKVRIGFIGDVHDIIKQCPQHTFIILTKRIENAADFYRHTRHKKDLPFKNLHLGVSISNPEENWKADVLRGIPAAVRFISFEPLLADIGELSLNGIHWVTVGGESGPGARPMQPDWARSIRDQCIAANVPFFFKQWGKKNAGRILDGKIWNQYPEVKNENHKDNI